VGVPHVYVSGGSDRISIFTLDRATGALAAKGAAPAPDKPGYLAFSADKRFLYAVGGGRVTAYAIDRATGALAPIEGAAPTGGTGPPHIGVHPSGKWVLVPHFRSGDLSVLPVLPNGGVAPHVDLQKTAPEAHQVVLDASGRYVFVPCRSGDAVMQFAIDPATGKLAPNDPPSVASEAGAGPRHMDFHPSGRWAYVLNEKNGTITSYRYDAARGTLADPQVLGTVPEGFEERASAHVVVHPSGRFVYASNRRHNSIVVFAVDESTGRLALVGHELGDGLIKTPRDFTLDPTGEFLLVANQGSGTLLVLRIDAATGKLARAGEPTSGLGAPSYVGAILLP
jgi:6-phosphogluconolactonase